MHQYGSMPSPFRRRYVVEQVAQVRERERHVVGPCRELRTIGEPRHRGDSDAMVLVVEAEEGDGVVGVDDRRAEHGLVPPQEFGEAGRPQDEVRQLDGRNPTAAGRAWPGDLLRCACECLLLKAHGLGRLSDHTILDRPDTLDVDSDRRTPGATARCTARAAEARLSVRGAARPRARGRPRSGTSRTGAASCSARIAAGPGSPPARWRTR